MIDAARLAILDKALANIQKEHGKGIIATTSGESKVERYYVASPGLADIMGGGTPKGRLIEIYGAESAGKTTIACFLAGCIQAQGGIAAFVDAEHGLDPEFAEKVGLQTDISKGNFILCQPDNGEQGLEIVEELASTGVVNVIVVDSVSALVPKAEIEGDMGDSHMGLQARLMSQACRKLTAIADKTGCAIIFINQIRMKIGVMFGNPETTTGGLALKYYSSIRLDVRKVEWITLGGEDGKIVGMKSRVKCVKNKTAAPMKKAEINLYFDTGIDIFGDYIERGVSQKIIDKAGSWYAYGNERLGQGIENVKVFFKANPDLFDKIKEKIDLVYGFAPMEKIGETVADVKEIPKERKTIKTSEAPVTMELPAEVIISE